MAVVQAWAEALALVEGPYCRCSWYPLPCAILPPLRSRRGTPLLWIAVHDDAADRAATACGRRVPLSDFRFPLIGQSRPLCEAWAPVEAAGDCPAAAETAFLRAGLAVGATKGQECEGAARRQFGPLTGSHMAG
jgi:hypothetical protein